MAPSTNIIVGFYWTPLTVYLQLHKNMDGLYPDGCLVSSLNGHEMYWSGTVASAVNHFWVPISYSEMMRNLPGLPGNLCSNVPPPKTVGTEETHSKGHQELDLVTARDGWGKCHVILSRMLFKSPEDLTGKLGPWTNLTPHLHFIFRRDSPSHESQTQAWCFRTGKFASVTWGSYILWVL